MILQIFLYTYATGRQVVRKLTKTFAIRPNKRESIPGPRLVSATVRIEKRKEISLVMHASQLFGWFPTTRRVIGSHP
jgi:hypothetical protein